MKKAISSFSIRHMFVVLSAVIVVLAVCQREVEVEFVGNQPDDMKPGYYIALVDDGGSENRLEGVFLRYSVENKTAFVAEIRMLDWLRLTREHDYLLKGEELLYCPTVRLAGTH